MAAHETTTTTKAKTHGSQSREAPEPARERIISVLNDQADVFDVPRKRFTQSAISRDANASEETVREVMDALVEGDDPQLADNLSVECDGHGAFGYTWIVDNAEVDEVPLDIDAIYGRDGESSDSTTSQEEDSTTESESEESNGAQVSLGDF